MQIRKARLEMMKENGLSSAVHHVLVAGGGVRQGVHARVPSGVRGRRQDVLEQVQDGEDGVRGGQGGAAARGGALQAARRGLTCGQCEWFFNQIQQTIESSR